jgi:ribonuclease-3
VLLKRKTDPLKSLERALGYAFKNRALLETALTVPSYRAERGNEGVADNQRLEFLGDAVFGLLSADRVFVRHEAEDEGRLTVRRSRLASGRALAEMARRIGLGPHLRLSKVDEASGGRDKDRGLADALEAVFGAAWQDGGLKAARAIFRKLVEGQPSDERDLWDENPKGCLQEIAQRHAWPDSPAYELVGSEGPAHAPIYTVRVRVAGDRQAVGVGPTKRAAEVAGARSLLAALRAAGLA